MQQDEILTFMKEHGPVIPATVARAMKTSILLASALLSTLVSQGAVCISSLKVGGGSPVYYLPEHRAGLQEYSTNLHEKEQRAYALLKQEAVLQDSKLDPLLRVSLQNMKDFAVPLKVTMAGNTELFWKWYILSNEEAGRVIRSLLHAESDLPAETLKEKEKEKPAQPTAPIRPVSSKGPKKKKQDASLGQFQTYFAKNNISIQSFIGKQGSQYIFHVAIPSPVGPLAYYCAAFHKKKITEADISTAYVRGQIAKLPILVLTTGQLSRNVEERLDSYKGLTLRRIDHGG